MVIICSNFYNYSYIGKKHFLNAKNTQKNKKILENIKKMHKNSSIKYKSNLLSLIANEYNKAELKSLGFNFNNTQFNTALKKANNENFILSNYQRKIPKSKSIINKETYKYIINSLLQNSHLSTNICKSSKLLYSLKDLNILFDPTIIYYLEKPKKTIYLELKIQNPNLKLSLNTFYKYCPKNF